MKICLELLAIITIATGINSADTYAMDFLQDIKDKAHQALLKISEETMDDQISEISDDVQEFLDEPVTFVRNLMKSGVKKFEDSTHERSSKLSRGVKKIIRKAIS